MRWSVASTHTIEQTCASTRFRLKHSDCCSAVMANPTAPNTRLWAAPVACWAQPQSHCCTAECWRPRRGPWKPVMAQLCRCCTASMPLLRHSCPISPPLLPAAAPGLASLLWQCISLLRGAGGCRQSEPGKTPPVRISPKEAADMA